MPVKIEYLTAKKGQRVIAISDIHGDVKTLKALLTKVNFRETDMLLIVGDIIEKGTTNLATVRYLMEFSKTHTVHCLLGNHDVMCAELNREDKNDELMRYLLTRKNSLLIEMCREQKLAINKEMDILGMKYLFREKYADIIQWFIDMPHIIQVGKFTFAHAAVFPGEMETMKPSQVMKSEAFMEKGYRFDSYHVFGHWPTVLYCHEIPDCNPRIDNDHKIISIDGANVLKRDGQLNALIIDDPETEEFGYTYMDSLPKARILNTQEPGGQSFSIPWTDNEVMPLRREKEFSYCEHTSSGYKMWIPNHYLKETAEGWFTEDITDYQLPTTFGDIVSVTEDTARGYLVKKDGIIGWYYGMLDFI